MGKAFRMAAGILGWAALILQYALVLTGTLGASSFTRSINFFSYFTILTNILAVLALTLPWLAPQYVMPVLFVIDWLFLVPKQTLKVSDSLGWLVFPVTYLVWTFIHGAYSGFYPYPFLNNSELGIARVLLNEVGLLVIFLVLGFILVSGGRLLNKYFKP